MPEARPAPYHDGVAQRTFAIGDIHGDFEQLEKLFRDLPVMDADDTIVFLGDYLDRGPESKRCVDFIRDDLPRKTKARIVALRGNHEDAWLHVIDKGFPEFLAPPNNGALACYRSYTNGKRPFLGELPKRSELEGISRGGFFPAEHVEWMRALPYWYEDEYAIYVHAGLPPHNGEFLHPREVSNPMVLLWVRTESFFRHYRGKPVVIGHTTTDQLPQELSSFTPDDPTDLWAGECVFALDTGCGKGGFLTALELPALTVYESR